MSWYFSRPYVSVAKRRANAAREMKKLEKSGQKVLPVRLEGRTIARTFWGKAWCDNLESYSDYSSRLPRGRTYVRNGSVCDLQIEPGVVKAKVCGSEMYTIQICIKPLDTKVWAAIKRECSGQVGSVIELLQGRLSQSVMQIITRPGSGLFPKPADIQLVCSCPDWANMCKHVAAALYGVGARLDTHPELLFVLRQVDHLDLISQAGEVASLTRRKAGQKTIAVKALSKVFGIELDEQTETTRLRRATRSAVLAEPQKESERESKQAATEKPERVGRDHSLSAAPPSRRSKGGPDRVKPAGMGPAEGRVPSHDKKKRSRTIG